MTIYHISDACEQDVYVDRWYDYVKWVGQDNYIPCVIFGGQSFIIGASSVSGAVTAYSAEIDDLAADTTPVTLSLDLLSLQDGVAHVYSESAVPSADYRLVVVPYKKDGTCASKPYVHQANGVSVFSLTPAAAGSQVDVPFTFEMIPGRADVGWGVAAFVQNWETGEILQSAFSAEVVPALDFVGLLAVLVGLGAAVQLGRSRRRQS